MNLNRPLIKQQAKQLMQNNVLKLFAISFIVSICVSAIADVCSVAINIKNIGNGFPAFQEYYNDFNNDFNNSDDDLNDYYGEDFNNFGNDFEEFGNEYNNDFYNFGQNDEAPPSSSVPYEYQFAWDFFKFSGIAALVSIISEISILLLSPLEVSLSGYYVSFIRGRRTDVGDGLNTVFRNTFKNNYGKKIALVFLRGLFCGLLSMLFIVPGIVYYYSTYFAYQIMADNPDISPIQALDISKNMVKGNRTELFVLDLSFIPWFLLCIFLFPIIYVMPYVSTTQALFYENFRIRALQQGRITEDDYLSDTQRYAKYANMYANPNNNNYQQYNQQYYNQQNPYYTQQNNPYYQPQQNGYQSNGGQYYTPNQNNNAPNYSQPQQPQEPQQPQQPQKNEAEYYSPEPQQVQPEENANPSVNEETKLYTDED